MKIYENKNFIKQMISSKDIEAFTKQMGAIGRTYGDKAVERIASQLSVANAELSGFVGGVGRKVIQNP